LDSITQLMLGAAVGEATLGRKVGGRAMLWGAVCGTLPDLDVLLPFPDPVAAFTYHRSFSHSLFVLAALTPLVVWLILKLHPSTRQWRGRWFVLVYLVFATHVLLDGLTVYGTQILWPFVTTPVAWSTVFIIDPLYTVPLSIGVLGTLAFRRLPQAHRWNTVGLTLSTLYLAWGAGAKLYVQDSVVATLAARDIPHERVLVMPAPFTTVLWRVLVMTPDGYYEGFRSLADGDAPLHLHFYRSEPRWLAGLEESWPVRRLQWFTKGFYAVSREGTDVVVTDLRMGLEPAYVFRFKVGEVRNPHAIPAPVRRLPARRDYERLPWLWARIWNPAAGAPPAVSRTGAMDTGRP